MKITSCEVLPSVKEFFPSIKNELTKVTWAHEFYGPNDFRDARVEKRMMMSGDVILRINTTTPWMKNIMPLYVFLDKVVKAKSLGVKLSFGSISAFKEAIKVLQSMKNMLTFPLWLNGITSNMNDKEIDEFLSLCTHNFPEATISIGFNRMGYKAPANPMKLDAELITKMKETLTRNNVTQTVAFPIEVRSAALSLDTLPALKDVHGITDSALYIYGGPTSSDEYVRLAPQLRKLVENFGKDRVYLALGDKVLKSFRASHVF